MASLLEKALGVIAAPVVYPTKAVVGAIDWAGKSVGAWGGPDEVSAEDKLAQAAAGLSAAQLEEQKEHATWR
jgi:hypothetical protein